MERSELGLVAATLWSVCDLPARAGAPNYLPEGCSTNEK
jgi:hypothetical protein